MPTLDWIGKSKVMNHHLDVPYHILDEKYTYNKNGTSQNKIIHGDNLIALKSLLPEYEGKIKCIYIDPPYNTGNEKWIYNDNVNDPIIKKWLGEVVGAEDVDLSRHDKWLCMMYPRLKLLYQLLSNDGSIFISIDNNESAHLRLICDEIFGLNNFVTEFVWKARTSVQHTEPLVTTQTQRILYYVKNKSMWNYNHGLKLNRIRKPYDATEYSNPDNDPRGPWLSSGKTRNDGRQQYTVVSPTGVKFTKPWIPSPEEFARWEKDGLIWWGKNNDSIPRKKAFLSDFKGDAISDILFDEFTTEIVNENKLNKTKYWEIGTSESGTNEVKSIFDNKTDFNFPKPSKLIKYLIRISTEKDSLVLDSFAGSGTTAHAVLGLNKEDGGNRHFILIELGAYAESITAERVRRVINGYGKTDGTDGDFTYYELGEPILLQNRNLNEKLPDEKIKEYIWITETHTPYIKQEKPFYLGTINSTSYYFFYDKKDITTLDYDTLAKISIKEDAYVIFADICSLSDEELLNYNITFKKIPRDITTL